MFIMKVDFIQLTTFYSIISSNSESRIRILRVNQYDDKLI